MFHFYFAPYSEGPAHHIVMNDHETNEFIHDAKFDIYPHEFIIYVAG